LTIKIENIPAKPVNPIRSRVCARCGKSLKNPDSVERGFGPVCWSLHQAEKAAEEEKKSTGGVYDGGDIVLSRKGDYPITNVPHAIAFHSLTGFEWGYGGSGPAELALNILYAVTGDRKFSMKHHQDFKWDFVAVMPVEGGVIKRDEILAWLKEREGREEDDAKK
jgi:hypothetical protein